MQRTRGHNSARSVISSLAGPIPATAAAPSRWIMGADRRTPYHTHPPETPTYARTAIIKAPGTERARPVARRRLTPPCQAVVRRPGRQPEAAGAAPDGPVWLPGVLACIGPAGGARDRHRSG